jgi:hypothetical protein
MDLTSINMAFASLDLIRKGLAAAIDVRDFNRAAAEVSKLNEALLATQNSAFAQNAAFFELQRKYFETAEDLRKLRETIAEKERYTLFEISHGVFVYRVNQAPQESRAGVPLPPEPEHYICPKCWQDGVKAILNLSGAHWRCLACKTGYYTGERAPILPFESEWGGGS